MQALQPLLASGRMQLAFIPASILDHEDGRPEHEGRAVALSLPPGGWPCGEGMRWIASPLASIVSPSLYPSGFPLFRIGRQTLSCALAAPVSAARSLSGISVRSSLNDGDG